MMTFNVTPDSGEPYTVTATSRDVLAWEKGGRNRSFSQLANNLAMVDMYALAYTSARRQGLYAGTLQEWESAVDLMPTDEDQEEEEPGPTQEGPSPGPSLTSPAQPESRPRSGRKKGTEQS